MRNRVLDMATNIMLSGVCPETSRKDLFKKVIWAHNKGYVYTNSDQSAYAVAYRIPYWDMKYTEEMPEEENGSILYVALACSLSKDRAVLLKMLRACCKLNQCDEVIYFRRNSDTDFKRMKVRGELNVKA